MFFFLSLLNRSDQIVHFTVYWIRVFVFNSIIAFNLHSTRCLSIRMVAKAASARHKSNCLIRDCVSCRWTKWNKPFEKPIHDRIYCTHTYNLIRVYVVFCGESIKQYTCGTQCLLVIGRPTNLNHKKLDKFRWNKITFIFIAFVRFLKIRLHFDYLIRCNFVHISFGWFEFETAKFILIHAWIETNITIDFKIGTNCHSYMIPNVAIVGYSQRELKKKPTKILEKSLGSSK